MLLSITEEDIKQILFELCEDETVFKDGVDLIESGLLDSYALISLFGELEDRGIFLHMTRIDRNMLRTVSSIGQLVRECETVR